MSRSIGILDFHFCDNYGAVVGPWALQQVLQKHFQAESEIIDYAKPGYPVQDPAFRDFLGRFAVLSPFRVETCASLQVLARKYHTVIVGSDQVFRSPPESPYYLGWVHGDVRCIAYAASFGLDRYDGGWLARRRAGRMLARFDALSVRESSGLSILRSFGQCGVQTLDPTLLLDAQDYAAVADADSPVSAPYVAVMFLEKAHEAEFGRSPLYARLARSYGIVDVLRKENGGFRPVSQWLALMRDAAFVVTDSFHGTAFSVIFRKPFVTRATLGRGNARIESLFRTLGIAEKHFLHSFLAEHAASLAEGMPDYDSVALRLKAERESSLGYLRESLVLPPKTKAFLPILEHRIVLPVLSMDETETERRMLLFGVLPFAAKNRETGHVRLLGCITLTPSHTAALRVFLRHPFSALFRKK